MPKIIIKKATTSTAVTANPLPNFLILRPLPLNDPRVVAGRQLQLVKIQQSNVAPIITTAGGSVQTYGGKVFISNKKNPLNGQNNKLCPF